MRLRLIAHVQHDAAVTEFDGDGFIRIDELVRAGHRDLTRKPRLAAIITIDRRGDTGPMRVASRSGGKPDRHDEAATLELNAVIGSRGEHLPIVVFLEGFEGGRDLDRCTPVHAVIITSLIEAAHVLQTKNHVHRPVAIRDQHRVVVSHVFRVGLL